MGDTTAPRPDPVAHRPATPAGVDRQRRREARADGVVHVLGVGGSLAGFALLSPAAAAAEDAVRAVAVLVYGAALVATLGVSALYNTFRERPVGPMLRRLDHAMIFMMIAATYTPFLAVALGGPWGWGLLAVVWVIALAGVGVKLLRPERYERLAIVLYLGLGWAIVVAPGPLFAAVSVPAIGLLALGGVLYSGGVVFYLLDRLQYHRAIWHGFVLAAATCHFMAVWGEVAKPGFWT